MLKSLFATVAIFIASIFGAPHANVAIDRNQPAAAAVAVVKSSDPFHPASTTTPVSPNSPATATADSTSSAEATIIKNYITQPVIERIVQSPPIPGSVLGASTDATAAKLSDLQDQINALRASWQPTFIPSFSGPAASTPVSFATFAQSQKIDQLSNVTISNATVSSVSGLTDADIPDNITASNYLPLSGGTLTGDLTMTGTLTAATLSVAGISSSGALIGPYVTATSTTATSTFAGPFAIGNNTLTALSNANVGIGTTSPGSLLSLNNIANFTTATSSFYSAGGVNLAAGCFAIGGNCLSLGNISGTLAVSSGGTGATTFAQGWIYSNGGSGALAASTSPTVNYITATSTIATSSFAGMLAVGNNALNVLSNGNVGIGTATPQADFDIERTASSSIQIGTSDTLNPTWADFTSPASNLFIGLESNGGGGLLNGSYGTAGVITTHAAASLQFGTSNTLRMTILSSGNVGIGTNGPGKTFQVNGNAQIGSSTINNNLGSVLATRATSDRQLALFRSGVGAWGVNVNSSGNFYLDNDSVNNNGGFVPLTVAYSSGNVGIGTTSPYSMLSVAGQVVGQNFVATSSIATNTLAGNLILGTGSNNTILIGTTTPFSDPSSDVGVFDDMSNGHSAWYITQGKNGTQSVLTAALQRPAFYINNFNNLTGLYLQKIANGAGDYIVVENSSGGSLFNVKTSGNVGIGTTSSNMLLSVGSATPVGSVAHFENSTGSCYINPTTTSLSCSSDARLKTNIVSLTDGQGLDTLLKLNPVTYNWNREFATTSPHVGFIAQEVQPVLPDLVSQGPDGFFTLNYAGFTPYIIKAIQQIANRINDFADRFTTKELTFVRATGDEIDVHHVHTDELCVGSTCMTEDQLKALLQAAGQTPAAVSPTQAAPPSDSTSSPQADLSPTITDATSTPEVDSPSIIPDSGASSKPDETPVDEQVSSSTT